MATATGAERVAGVLAGADQLAGVVLELGHLVQEVGVLRHEVEHRPGRLRAARGVDAHVVASTPARSRASI
ncbi:hypothetical protein [Streptomyces sp. NPDC088762]|uniref:hypothetical protein n=1 Tax=Streptomyces sp. NPDC088762 TaxID=3365891 RepID=UPI0038303687